MNIYLPMLTFRERDEEIGKKKTPNPNIQNVYFSFYYSYSLSPYSGSFNIVLSLLQQLFYDAAKPWL